MNLMKITNVLILIFIGNNLESNNNLSTLVSNSLKIE